MDGTESASPVLILAPTGRDAMAAAQLLGRAGFAARICADGCALAGALDGAGAVLVAEEGLLGQRQEVLADWVGRQPPWSDLPFVMLTGRRDDQRMRRWRQEQIAGLGNVSLIERPVQPLTLVSVVRAALRARGRQLEIRALLEARDAAAASLEAQVQARTTELRALNARLREEMEERVRVQDSLRHAQKMEALGQLTGGVAHDFNNLLMVISGGLDMLARNEDPARRERFMLAMRQAAERGAALTRQLLTFSRSHALQAETVLLPALIGNMDELLDRSLRGDVEVEVRLAPDVWPVFVDAGEFELAILNLAVNARDAMAGGGCIVIAADNVIEELDGKPREMVRLVVRDTGSGMSDEVLARVFEPFFTTKDVGKGSGLGLAQVYGFAKQSGGRVSIETAVGKGTAITLLLPRSTRALEDDESGPPAAEGPASAAGACVLLVEDDPAVAGLVADMLDSLGYEVLQARSVQAALGALAGGQRVDLVFSDIMMPGGMDGLALAREVRRRREGLPVLLTSAFAETAAAQARAMGIAVLRKPYGIEELRLALRQVLAVAADA